MKTHNIVGKRKLWFGISLTVIFLGIISLVLYGFNMGIDFTGGNLLHYDMHQDYSLPEVRSVLDNLNLKEYEPKKAGNPEHELIIKTTAISKEDQSKILATLKQHWNQAELVRAETIDPIIGKELQKQAILALIIANIGMLIYITFRFEFRSAIGAVLALIHDILVIIPTLLMIQHL